VAPRDVIRCRAASERQILFAAGSLYDYLTFAIETCDLRRNAEPGRRRSPCRRRRRPASGWRDTAPQESGTEEIDRSMPSARVQVNTARLPGASHRADVGTSHPAPNRSMYAVLPWGEVVFG